MKESKWIRKLERSYLYVILLLPIAAIILRLSTIKELSLLSQYGLVIYANLPLLYAMIIAYGFSKKNPGISVFSAAISYLLFESAYLSINPDNNIYILGGIITGGLVAFMSNQTAKHKFGGSLELLSEMRFLPVLSSIVLFFSGLIIGHIWPVISRAIEHFSIWIAESGVFGSFLYGSFNRLLVPLGLHHNLNHYLWYEYGEFEGVYGDMSRYFAGDLTAGTYMSGFFIVMMFGLPAIMLGFYHRIDKDNRYAVKGIYIVSSLICILTGITEPVELIFLFLLPKLYIIHAILTGLAMALTDVLNIHVGFDFSAGLIDYIFNFGKQEGSLYILPLGLMFGIIYYTITVKYVNFRHFVSPGDQIESESNQRKFAKTIVAVIEEAFGGFDNIKYVNVKFTRFEFCVKDPFKVNTLLINEIKNTHFIKINNEVYQLITSNQGKYLNEAVHEAFKHKVI